MAPEANTMGDRVRISGFEGYLATVVRVAVFYIPKMVLMNVMTQYCQL